VRKLLFCFLFGALGRHVDHVVKAVSSREAVQNKTGKNAGRRSICFNGKKKGVEYPKARYEQYRAHDFAIFREVTKLVVKP
jgi:hypothetical protein